MSIFVSVTPPNTPLKVVVDAQELERMIDDRIAAHVAPARAAYSVAEVAECLGVSRATISNRVKAGDIPTTEIPGCGRVLIPAAWVHSLGEVGDT